MRKASDQKLLEQIAEQFSSTYSEWTTETHRNLPDDFELLIGRKPFAANVIASALASLKTQYALIQFWGSPFLMVAKEQVKSTISIHLISCCCVVPPEAPSAIGSRAEADLINGLCLAKEIADAVLGRDTIVTCGIISLYTSDSFDCVTSASSRFFDCVYNKAVSNLVEDVARRNFRHFYNSICTTIRTTSQFP